MRKILILIIGMFFVFMNLAYADLDTNLENYWDLEIDQATATDQCGNADWNSRTGDTFKTEDCLKGNCINVTGQGLRGITDGSFSIDTGAWGISLGQLKLDELPANDKPINIIGTGAGAPGRMQVVIGSTNTGACPEKIKLAVGNAAFGDITATGGCGIKDDFATGVDYTVDVTFNTTHYSVYIDGILDLSFASASVMGTTNRIHFKDTGAGNSPFPGFGIIDELAVWSGRALNQQEITDKYNGGDVKTSDGCSFVPDEPPVATTAFTLTGTDTYDGSALENITVFVTNSSFSFSQSTSNGTIILLNSSFTFNSTYDIKFASNQSGGYLNHSFNSINITERGSFQGDLFQSRVIVNAKEVITNDTILSFTTSVPLQTNSSNSTGQSVLLLKAGSYDLIGDAAGYMLRGFNFTVNPKQEINVNITLGTANLTITAISSAGAVNYFNTTMTLLSTGFSETIETNTGTAVFPAITGFFNVSINSTDWTFDHKTITIIAEDTLPNITFNLFSKNSINITIFDEETNEIIDYTTTTLIMDNINQKFTNTTTTGNVFFIELFDGLWDLLVSTAFHNQREYIFTIVPQTTSRLNVYLLNSSNGDLTTFNIKNKEDQTLPGSTISVSNKINNTFVTVAQSVSDFAGQSNIFLSSTNEYRFTIDADTFTTKVFDLVPLANTYDIIMDPVDAVDFTTIYDVLSYTMIPASILTPQQEQNISFITSSPLGYISYFGLNTSFNSTTNRITNVSGSLAGGTASIFINTTDHTGTHIPVDFFIKIAGEPEIRIHHSYRTSLFITPGNISSVSIADKYKDSFTNVGKSLIIVIGAVAVILSLAEAGAPALANGIAGAIVIIFGVIIGWISPAVGIIITFITVTMVIFRRAD
tara:strand:+ start:258 stop:2885 length:2628 start_codon:yes stop_codon:yes gene_type:complete